MGISTLPVPRNYDFCTHILPVVLVDNVLVVICRFFFFIMYCVLTKSVSVLLPKHCWQGIQNHLSVCLSVRCCCCSCVRAFRTRTQTSFLLQCMWMSLSTGTSASWLKLLYGRMRQPPVSRQILPKSSSSTQVREKDIAARVCGVCVREGERERVLEHSRKRDTCCCFVCVCERERECGREQ